jgi:hypothetical protein
MELELSTRSEELQQSLLSHSFQSCETVSTDKATSKSSQLSTHTRLFVGGLLIFVTGYYVAIFGWVFLTPRQQFNFHSTTDPYDLTDTLWGLMQTIGLLLMTAADVNM